ncbi:hypothetical protein FQN60_010550 [Etheostoma spectabile]|uniref:Uncharacterized protein n=1 Tax=Etheostoma spectabile TaxID=54343 RepID=A0A5J5D9L3_9PERO|nr:hypothetical protein FQN60_010550 [Etheostoma spectabile]
MNRDRAGPGPGADGVQTGISRDRAAAGPVAEAVQTVMSRDRAVPAPGGDGVQTVVGPDSGDLLDGGAAGNKRLFSSAVPGGRDAQAGENHSEPPPTNPVLAPPQQGPTGHRTTSFSVLDILDPNKFTSSRRLPQQHAGQRAERELGAFGAENRRGGAGEAGLEPGLEPAKGCYAPEEYPSSKSRLMAGAPSTWLSLNTQRLTGFSFFNSFRLNLCLGRKALCSEAQTRRTTTEPGALTQMLQTGPTAVRRAAQLCPVTETEIWASTATRTLAETPKAPEAAPRARSATGHLAMHAGYGHHHAPASSLVQLPFLTASHVLSPFMLGTQSYAAPAFYSTHL